MFNVLSFYWLMNITLIPIGMEEKVEVLLKVINGSFRPISICKLVTQESKWQDM